MNVYLEKVAEKSTRKGEKARLAAEGAIGASAIKGSSGKILGYHVVHHGTTASNAAKIKKEGFKTSMGGTGASTLRDNYVESSKGKIHVTKSKLSSRMYSGNLGHHAKGFDGTPGSSLGVIGKSLRDSFSRKAGVVSARVSDAQWKRFKVDGDSSTAGMFDDAHRKDIGATYSRDISSKQIKGGKGSKGVLPYLSKKNLTRYLSTNDGRTRALKGGAQLAIGSALVAHAASRLSNSKAKK